VTEANPQLEDDPSIINTDPYGAGWIIKVEVGVTGELEQLLDAAEYVKLTE
jgi:glycine cleavage system H protein